MAVEPKGYVVASNEGPVWDMETGRPAAFKLLSEHTGGKIAVFEEVSGVSTYETDLAD